MKVKNKMKIRLIAMLLLCIMIIDTITITTHAIDIGIFEEEATSVSHGEFMPTSALSCSTDMHHIFPQKYRDQFNEILMPNNIDQYKVPWDSSIHRSSSYNYNVDWAYFFLSNPSPTRADLFSFAHMLSLKYDFPWYW